MAGPGPRGRPRAGRRRGRSPPSRRKLLASGLSVAQLVRTAWASAASFRGTDKRGGANGARIRLEPQQDWAVNDPAELATVLPTLERVQQDFNDAPVRRQAGLARRPDRSRRLRRRRAGGQATPATTSPSRSRRDVRTPRRSRPTWSRSRCSSRRPTGSATTSAPGEKLPPEILLLDRANLLNLTAPEMTVLVGGMRALDANAGQSAHGVLTDRPGTLTNDFFVNLLDRARSGRRPSTSENVFEGRDRATGEVRWTATAVDLVFGSNSQLRAIAEVYASDDAEGEVRPRLRRRLGQGHEPRPVRPRLIAGGRVPAFGSGRRPVMHSAPRSSRARRTPRSRRPAPGGPPTP